MSLFAAGPFLLAELLDGALAVKGALSITSSFFSSTISDLLSESDSENSPIISALLTISPSFFKIFETKPLDGATTSKTTLSVSISAITSSCPTLSPSFLTQFATVPSAMDSGKVGDLISIAIMFPILKPLQQDDFAVLDGASSYQQLELLLQVY